MANPNPVPPPIHSRFKPGQSGNPAGNPASLRQKLEANFTRELKDDFEKHGKEALVACRKQKPDVYIKVIASMMPKQLEVKRPLEEIADDQLAEAVAALQAFLANKGQTLQVSNETMQ
jgi:hypothetical protein